MKKNAFKNPVIGARIDGNTRTSRTLSHAHLKTVSVVSAITWVVLVLAAGTGSLDILGKLGIKELHDIGRISKAAQAKRFTLKAPSSS